MFDGHMKDGGLYYIQEFDENEVMKNENLYFEVFAELKEKNVNIYFNFFDIYKFWKNHDFAYAFYKITDMQDTINLMDNIFEIINLDTSLYVIPFNYKNKEKYLCQFAIKTMENYEYWTRLYTLEFGFNDKGIFYSEYFKMPPISINLKYPYTLIFDTLFFDNYSDLLDKADLVLEHLTPASCGISISE